MSSVKATSKLQRFVNALSSNCAIFIFAIYYLCLSLINYCFLFSGTKIPAYLSYPLIAYGFVILVAALFAKRIEWKSWQFVLCAAFIVSFVVSLVFARQFGITENLKGLIWTGCQMIILGCIGQKSLKDKYLDKFLSFVFIVAFVLSLVSLLMSLLGFMYYPSFVGADTVDGGMSHGRLYGFYADPNYAGMFSLIGFVIGLYKLFTKKNKVQIVFICFCMLSILAFIGLCGSRSVLVALIVVMFVFCCFIFVVKMLKKKFEDSKRDENNYAGKNYADAEAVELSQQRKRNKFKVSHVFASILLSGVCICGVLGIMIGVEFIYEKAIPSISATYNGTYTDPKHAFTVQVADKIRDANSMQNPYSEYRGVWDKLLVYDNFAGSEESDVANNISATNSSSDSTTSTNVQSDSASSTNTASDKYKNGEVDTGHVGILGRDESQDVTNRRSSIWKSAIELFKSSPAIGLSNRNFLAYAKQNLPNTFIAQTNFQAMHNVFFDVLVSQGVLGIIIYVALLILVLISILKNLRWFYKNLMSNTANKAQIALLYKYLCVCAILLICVISSVFLTDILYVNTPSTIMFWCVFGFATIKTKKVIPS